MEDGFLKRMWRRFDGSSSDPVKLNLVPPKASAAQARHPGPATQPKQGELVPGNFFLFDFFLQVPIAGTVHIGSPKIAIRDISTGTLRWGSKPEHSYPRSDSVLIPWVDDSERGITARQIIKPEDILGAEGKLGDDRFRFERILDLGKNVAVYGLLNTDKLWRTAYGFNRDAVEPGYVSPAEMEIRLIASRREQSSHEAKTSAGNSKYASLPEKD